MIARDLIREVRPHLSAVPRTVPADLVPHLAGHYRLSRRHLLHRTQSGAPMTKHAQILAWLRDNVHPDIPRNYYKLVLGHDLHISTYARLYVKHFHATQPDPFRRGVIGWWEDVGLVSEGKVTTAFRDFEIDSLVAAPTLYDDFQHHEVGTSGTTDVNSDTALIATTGIARVSGTKVEASAAVYRSVATVTADTTETWQEHGIFNASTSGTLMDRSLISPTVAVVASDTVQFTYELTKAAES